MNCNGTWLQFVTVQVGDGDTVGNFLKEVSHTLQELSKHVLFTVRSVILSYICYHFPKGASVTVTRNSKNAFAGAPRPALRRKRERTAGVGEL